MKNEERVSAMTTITSLMRYVVFPAVLTLSAIVYGAPAWAEKPCENYSDDFTTFDTRKWYDTTLYAESPGSVSIQNGQLELKAPRTDKSVEIQVYGLFTFDGDFDVQTDYAVEYSLEGAECRFNAGVVLQTLGDEISYKFYISKAPRKDGAPLFHRFRVDEKGERNIVLLKSETADDQGTLRIVRERDRIVLYRLSGQNWENLFETRLFSGDKLRLRFKLQTEHEASAQTCPAAVRFDNFRVNSCHLVLDE